MKTFQFYSSPKISWATLTSVLLWCAGAFSMGFWVLSFPSTYQSETAVISMSSVPSVDTTETIRYSARALGTVESLTQVSIAQSSRYQLLGVIAGTSGRGSALISIDGQPAKAYLVGQRLSEEVVLKNLGPKQAQLGADVDGKASFALTLPATND